METQRAFDGVLPVSVQRPENQETTCPKVNRLETEEELMLLFKSKGRKKDKSWFQGSHAGRILSHLGKGLPFCSIQAHLH